MIASDSFLHFVLDAEADIHCTDSLVSLSPEAFLWHELNCRDAGQNVLLFDLREGGRMRVEVFDSDSRRFLIPPQKSFLSFGKAEEEPRTIARSSYSITDAKLTEEDLLAKLLSRANARNAERRTALVFTHTAFERVCRMADTDGVERMNAQLEANTGKCTIYVRLPLRAEELQKLVQKDLSGCPLLQRVYERFSEALGEPPEPLLDILERKLGDRLTRFDHRPQDVRNLLLKQALSDPASVDTLEQLKDQADYLELCRRYSIGLLPAPVGEACFTRVSHRQLWEQLQDERFRSRLRSRTAELRGRYRSGSLEKALEAENQLPPARPHPVCEDKLARTALGLSLPDSCSRKASWDVTLDEIKRNLSTLWNTPHNQVSHEAAAELCREAHGTIRRSDWATMEHILKLLRFFAKQICADEDRSEALGTVWTMGRELIRQSSFVCSERPFGTREGYAKIIGRAEDTYDEEILRQLKDIVYNDINDFDRPNLVIADLMRKLEADRNRITERIEQSRRAKEYLREQELQREQEKARRRRSDELTVKYTGPMDSAIEPEDDMVQPIDPNRYLEERKQNIDFL